MVNATTVRLHIDGRTTRPLCFVKKFTFFLHTPNYSNIQLAVSTLARPVVDLGDHKVSS
jgi:hypothetical protein